MKNLIYLFTFLIFISSCDEINKLINPSDEYLIDKTISASSSEQIIETGTEFKMIFPANSVKGEFILKIKKEGSYPTFNIPNAKLSSNTYRIKFSGNTAFATPVKIIINYDKSEIPAGKTAAEIIQAYIYANRKWKLATYQLDEPNSKIIVSIINLESPNTNKDKPELQGDGDLVIGSGQKTINDSGQNDLDQININESFTPVVYYEPDMPDSFKVDIKVSGYIKSKGIKSKSRYQDSYYHNLIHFYDAPDSIINIELDIEIKKLKTKFDTTTGFWGDLSWTFEPIDDIFIETYAHQEKETHWDAIPIKFSKQVVNGNHISMSTTLPSFYMNNIKTLTNIRFQIGYYGKKTITNGYGTKTEVLDNKFAYFWLAILRLK
jgi:hypothetical protein